MFRTSHLLDLRYAESRKDDELSYQDFSESLDLFHASSQMDDSDLRRGFHWKETRSLVLKIPDLLNIDMPMGFSFSGIFSSLRIYATRLGEMDGLDSASGYHDLRCSVDTMCLSS
jgi:hypothetical protein